jgi:hypothetical protein
MVKVIIIQVVFIVMIVILYNSLVKLGKKSKLKGYRTYDRNQYELIVGEDALQIFKRFNVTELHGLSVEGAEQRIKQGGTYIDGLSNYHPKDVDLMLSPKPFLFLNLYAIKHHYTNDQIPTLVMHECMHMAMKLWAYKVDAYEEQMITWAEEEANAVVKLLKKEKLIL